MASRTLMYRKGWLEEAHVEFLTHSRIMLVTFEAVLHALGTKDCQEVAWIETEP